MKHLPLFAAFALILGLVGCSYNYTDEYFIQNEADAGDAGPIYIAEGECYMTGKAAALGLASAKDLGWSQSGKLTTGNPNTKISMQVQFPVCDSYTVQFGIIPPQRQGTPPTDFQPVLDVIADLTWSVKGNFVTRRVSVGNGMSISGVAEAVKVDVKDITASPLSLGFDYIASIQVSPGTRPSQGQPPTLKATPFVFAIPAGSSQTIAIPTEAGAISVETSVATNLAGVSPDVEVDQCIFEFPALVLKSYNALVESGFVALAPSATGITVRNKDVTNAVNVALTFGIDG